ncbi:hypothetical protein LG296_20865 (plasmid) [Ureibacillus chungkukjangi]|uniref:hypothetical protein n=1 Tax=Ureibacillus chungkukjangi TaxID=1202712 RepID=UPI000D3C8DF3|nr:hypothetical protein [Ureibacillus chungkukjangi]MCM3390007.1 hypothetical protein [Ureibacillus chungkukjangi]
MFEKNDTVEIIDSELLALDKSRHRLMKHYQTGKTAYVVDKFLDMVEIQLSKSICSILLKPSEYDAIRKIGVTCSVEIKVIQPISLQPEQLTLF